MTKKQTILVTGASGMLGSKICTILAQKGFYVLAVYNSNQEFVPSAKNIEKLNIDITKKIQISGLKNIDTIIHCAAVTDVNFCELNKDICGKVNVDGTKNLINLAKLSDAKFIYISTPMVFSGKKGGYKEDDKTSPPNYYGQTKVLAEKLVLKYKKGLVIRTNPIGKRPLGAHPSFMQWFVDMAANNRSFGLFTDVTINPVSTATLSNILAELIIHFEPGILHIGSRDIVNKAKIWDEVLKYFPNYSGKVTRVSVNKTHTGKIASRPHQTWLKVEKAQKLGYKMPAWKDEINQVIKDIVN